MSVQASSWVIKHSKQKGSALLVLLMIANHAHADGTNAFPSVKTLAEECRMSERQITRIVAQLEQSGELLIDRSKGRAVHNYSILMTGNPVKLSPSNPAKLSESTLTKKKPNPDKSGNPTLTNPTPSLNKEEPSINRVEEAHSPAVAAVEEIFCFTPSIYSQEAIDASEIKDLSLWRRVLTEKKAQISAAEWNNHNFRQKQVGYCLANYRTAVDRQPAKTTAENIFFNPKTFQIKSYRPGGSN